MPEPDADGLFDDEQPARATAPIARAHARARPAMRGVKKVMPGSLREVTDRQTTER